MLCVSFKIRNRVNPEKLGAEVRKQPFIRLNFGSESMDKLPIHLHLRVDK